ncbi:hypothetical protein D3C72_1598930 [compost metagenome]
MSFRFHLPGFSNCSLSTLSVVTVKNGKSVRKFVKSICLGSMGRNGKTKEAAATLHILPKVEPVLMNKYFIVLAKVFLPSLMPSTNTIKSFSISTKSAASLATSTAFSTDIPTSVALIADTSLMPSPI